MVNRIPVTRVIDKVNTLFSRNDYVEAGRILTYWRDEAIALGDKSGQLAIENELVGYYRKQNDKTRGLAAVERAMTLVKELNQTQLASGATIMLNCATAYKAFGMPATAVTLYRQAEEIYNRVLESTDTRYGGLFNNMALSLVDIGEYTAAEEKYLAALRIVQEKTEAAITYINMAHMYETSGAREKIAGCMSKAYRLLTAEQPHDGHYAFVLEKCAPSFAHFGNQEVCRQFQEEARRIYEGN